MKFKRVVAVYIFNKYGQVLMLKHKKLGKWLPPGGHVEADELVHQAAVREVYEETGVEFDFIYNSIDLDDDENQKTTILPMPLFIQLEEKQNCIQEDFVYLAISKDTKIINNEQHEIDWFEYAQAINLETFNNVKNHLEHIHFKLKDIVLFK